MIKLNGVTILLNGGHKIETVHSWEELSQIIHEDEEDKEFIVDLGYGKWASIVKDQVVAYDNIRER